MNPRLLPRALAASLAAAAFVGVPASAAQAAESPRPATEAAAYGMDWIPYIDPADLPPVAQRKVVCLVDSGVDITPDLPPDRPEGPIVERVSIDGGSGLGGPAWENQHGTSMALIAGAVPGNDYGTAGVWPAVRILSVRAMPYGERVFPARGYLSGLRTCDFATAVHPLAVVNLSLGCRCQLDPEERAQLEDAIARVRAPHKNVSVVVAAGNDGGGLSVPADAGGVLPVAAGNDAGGLCEFASYDARAIVGPGCRSSGATLQVVGNWSADGSSGAASQVSVLIAVLRTLKPHAGHEEVERWIRTGARSVAGRGVLYGEGAARLAGLGDVVDRARARVTIPQGPAPEHQAPPTGIAAPSPKDGPRSGQRLRRPDSRATTEFLRAPSARIRWRSARLHVHLLRRPVAAERLVVRSWRGRERPRTFKRRIPGSDVVIARSTKRPTRISLTYEQDAYGKERRSRTTVFRLAIGGSYR